MLLDGCYVQSLAAHNCAIALIRLAEFPCKASCPVSLQLQSWNDSRSRFHSFALRPC